MAVVGPLRIEILTVRIRSNSAHHFDEFLPIYNWIYPLSYDRTQRLDKQSTRTAFADIAASNIHGRALYVHIPFCETICSFCPFVRGEFSTADEVERYTRALIAEINLKAELLKSNPVPIRTIFFGGGTPSVLSVEQLTRIIQTIYQCFDVSHLIEFSFEFEVKSVSIEKARALAALGVTHARFGVQTFDPLYRKHFTISATLDQLHLSAKILQNTFKNVSFDLLFGMNGQTDEHLLSDLQQAVALGIDNIDIYPINNTSTQTKLHRSFAAAGLAPISGLTKFYMNAFIREFMYEAGFLPHNGHGYIKATAKELESRPVVTDSYSFIYHEHVYGYEGFDVIGFGVNAVTSTSRFTLFNERSRTKYVKELLKDFSSSGTLCEHSRETDALRPIALHLPYHGELEKRRVDWEAIPQSTVTALSELISVGLVDDLNDRLKLTADGWHWYINLIYALLPISERRSLDQMIATARTRKGRRIEGSGFPDFASRATHISSR
jgi:oxygen-independent coproporphyrinogen-3 oxidase